MPDNQSQSGPQFIRLLRQAGVEADEHRLADMIWLARLMTPEKEPLPERKAPSPEAPQPDAPEAPEKAPAPTWAPIEVIVRTYREEPVSDVYLYTAADESGKIRVSKRRVAGVPPLPNEMALARSLRPFNRHLRSPGQGPLDEEATVEQAAETDLILPVEAPKWEKWFDAVIVYEDRPAMVVWRETVREFRRLLERHGAFRDARLWRILFPDQGEDPYLISHSGARRNLEAINDPAGRRLVFLFSDGVSKVWRDGRMRRVIDRWGERMPVVLVQVLGEEHWYRTAHGDPEATVRAPQAGSPNRRLKTGNGDGLALPIVMPYPRSLARWADMLMKGLTSSPALILDEPRGETSASPHPEPRPEPTVEQRLQPLTGAARKLAVYLSAVPLQAPIMRLVQRVMLPDSRIEHLAEVMLSGLVKRENPDQDVSNLAEDEIRFDFISSKTREELIQMLGYGELTYILRSVSEYLTERLGRRCDLRALILDSEGPLKVTEEEMPFARIADRALQLHGLRPTRKVGEAIETRGAGFVELSPFSFDTVTLDDRGKVIDRRRLESRHFVQELAPGISLEMVEIPGGKFLMGSPKSEKNRFNDEDPQHEATVPSFYIGKFAVTQAQWRIVAGWDKVERELKPEPSFFPQGKGRKESDDQRPVEQVSWEDAREFCARLTARTKRVYRLPSEAEWEYACRAGTTTPFAFGETITPEFVNYDGNYPYANAKKGEYRNETTPVGSLGVANAFGLYDMHGNVWEWCEDVWHENYQGAPIDGSAWLSGGDSSRRGLRGGSWHSFGNGCRSASRYYDGPGLRGYSVGCRVVVSARTS